MEVVPSRGINMTFYKDIKVSSQSWCTGLIGIMCYITWTNCKTWNQPRNCEKVTERSAPDYGM